MWKKTLVYLFINLAINVKNQVIQAIKQSGVYQKYYGIFLSQWGDGCQSSHWKIIANDGKGIYRQNCNCLSISLRGINVEKDTKPMFFVQLTHNLYKKMMIIVTDVTHSPLVRSSNNWAPGCVPLKAGHTPPQDHQNPTADRSHSWLHFPFQKRMGGPL